MSGASGTDPKAQGASLDGRVSKIRRALSFRRLGNRGKLSLLVQDGLLHDGAIEAVAEAALVDSEAAEDLLIRAATRVSFAATFQLVARTTRAKGRPADRYVSSVTKVCCEFWEERGRELKFSRPPGGGAATGPLIRLICYVHDMLLHDLRAANPDTVASYIEQIRKRRAGAA